MTPTYEIGPRCSADWKDLDRRAQRDFLVALEKFIEDLASEKGLRPGLRIKHVEGTDKVWELTFAPNGRATFQYGAERRPGLTHVIWRRVGSHDILDQP
ncbi:MAG: hypothetical protein LBK95_14875 [Bifidobacteriaceae bacterium]|jgi:hypothetical protein|nr:hypothetical protein [Bifidobacteriaceae bacterium]